MTWDALRVLLLLGVGGCHCRPDPSARTDTDRPQDTASRPTGETAAPPRCDVEEIEPNNQAVSANDLPLEAYACGWFQAPNDPDFWQFEVEEPGWMGVWLDARENGSLANPGLFVQGPGGVVVQRDDGDETADVHLRFFAQPGSWVLTVREQGFQGEDDGRWFYDLMATTQKAPRAWDAVESEPNNTHAEAQLLGSGQAVYGVIEAPGDVDVFRVDIPPGRHTLTAWIEAFALGSPADTRVLLRDAAGASPGCGGSNAQCRFDRGAVGFEADPWLQYTSEGAESLYLRVLSGDERGSAIHWYVLVLDLEGP